MQLRKPQEQEVEKYHNHRDEWQWGHPEEEILMLKEKGVDEGQTRVGKEEGTRDPYLSQKPMMEWETTNSSPPYLK